MPQLLLRAEENHADMYAAVDLVVEKLERQIRKYKTKVNRKFRQNGSVKQLFNNNMEALQEQVAQNGDPSNAEFPKIRLMILKSSVRNALI